MDRETLWKILEMSGFPDKLVNIIKFFHEGMLEKCQSVISRSLHLLLIIGLDKDVSILHLYD